MIGTLRAVVLVVVLALAAATTTPRLRLKVCSRCGRRRPLEAYRSNGDRLRAACKDCENEQRRNRRQRRDDERSARRAGVTSDPRASRRGRRPARRYSVGGRVITWIEAYCVFTKGRFRGKPFVLLEWQKRVLWRLFEVLPEDGVNPSEWRRRYEQGLIGLAKKNGKTELIAALGLWFLLDDDEPAPEIACAAGSDEQADLVFGAAKAMCELSPTLRRVTRVWEREIEVPERSGARMFRVAAGGGNLDGLNLYVVLIDELHEWTAAKHLATYRVLTNGVIGRTNPLILQITTAGFDQESICYRQYDYGKKVQAGEIDDPSFFFAWWEAPEFIADYRSREAFEAANPSHGVTVFYDRFLRDARRKPESETRRYNLNQWTEAEALWLPPRAWQLCLDEDLDLDRNSPTVVTVDAATKHDSCAVVLLQTQGERDVVRAWVWERPIDPRTNEPLETWRLPIEDVKTLLRDLHRRYNVRSIGYDPAFITWVADELEGEGYPMVEIPQTAGRMVPGSQGLYERVIQRRLAHDGHRALARHVRNAVAVSAPNGGWRLAKNKARRQMDAAIALAMAVYLTIEPGDDPKPAPVPHLWTDEED